MKFEVGELVVKTTGGPAMTVTDDIELVCLWADKGGWATQRFSQEELISLTDWMVRAFEKEEFRRRRRRK